MIESWVKGIKLSSGNAFKRAKELAIERNGSKNWNRGNTPSNRGEKRNISSINDLYYLVRGRGPVYAYYHNGKKGEKESAHLVVVTGVDLDKGFVYTNNPWGVSGKQTFKQFKNGVAKHWYHSDIGLKFKHVYLINY